MRNQSKRVFCFFLLVIVIASSCFMESQPGETGRIGKYLERKVQDLVSDGPNRRTVVYREVHTKSVGVEKFTTMIDGSLSDKRKQLVARPYRNLSGVESWVYDEDAWGSSDQDGNVEKGYSVTRRSNDNPTIVVPDMRPARLAPELVQQLLGQDNELITVFIAVRNFPDWDIPLAPQLGFMSIVDHQRLSASRDSKITARKSLLTQTSQNIEAYIIQNHGSVFREAWRVGYIWAELPRSKIRGLLNVSEVLRVEPNDLPDGEPLTRFYVGNQGQAISGAVQTHFFTKDTKEVSLTHLVMGIMICWRPS